MAQRCYFLPAHIWAFGIEGLWVQVMHRLQAKGELLHYSLCLFYFLIHNVGLGYYFL